jgi:hypothetical protein
MNLIQRRRCHSAWRGGTEDDYIERMDGVRNLLDWCSDDSMDVFVTLDPDRH